MTILSTTFIGNSKTLSASVSGTTVTSCIFCSNTAGWTVPSAAVTYSMTDDTSLFAATGTNYLGASGCGILPLANNGGFVFTMRVNDSSPAAYYNGSCDHILTTDARLYPRNPPCTSGSYQYVPATTSNFLTENFAFSCTFTATGDPHITGIEGQKFDFQGHPNGTFHFYSDDFISINAHFEQFPGKAEGKTGIDGIGILIGAEHSIVVTYRSLNRTNHWLTILADGEPMTIKRGFNWQTPFGCSKLTWIHPYFNLTYQDYFISIRFMKGYLNTMVKIPYERAKPSAMNGGLIGHSNKPGHPSTRGSEHILTRWSLTRAATTKATTIKVKDSRDSIFRDDSIALLLANSARSSVFQPSRAVRSWSPDSCPSLIKHMANSDTHPLSIVRRASERGLHPPLICPFLNQPPDTCSSSYVSTLNDLCSTYSIACGGPSDINAVCVVCNYYNTLPMFTSSPLDCTGITEWSELCTMLNEDSSETICNAYQNSRKLPVDPEEEPFFFYRPLQQVIGHSHWRL
mgnify:CR=1 FL=1